MDLFYKIIALLGGLSMFLYGMRIMGDGLKQSSGGAMKLALRRYPNLLATMKNRHIDYNRSRKLVFAEEKAGRAFVICPDEPLPIGRIEHDPEVMKKAYEIGRKAAESRLEELKAFMNI